MRLLPCPNCGTAISTSWADFIFFPNRGPRLFCLSCKTFCRPDARSSLFAFLSGLIALLVPLYVFVVSGLVPPHPLITLAALVIGFILFMVVYSVAQARTVVLHKS
jgi:hypothetical protein